MECKKCSGSGFMKKKEKCNNCLKKNTIQCYLCENAKKYGQYTTCDKCLGSGLNKIIKSTR